MRNEKKIRITKKIRECCAEYNCSVAEAYHILKRKKNGNSKRDKFKKPDPRLP